MTSNLKKAAEIIGREYMDAMSGPTPSAWRGQIAEALDDAGLLAPDLPAPDEGEWEVGRNVISLDGMHILPMIDSDALTPDEARDLALALLAVADHAETEVTDG